MLDKDKILIVKAKPDEINTILGEEYFMDFSVILTASEDIIKHKDAIIAFSRAK